MGGYNSGIGAYMDSFENVPRRMGIGDYTRDDESFSAFKTRIYAGTQEPSSYRWDGEHLLPIAIRSRRSWTTEDGIVNGALAGCTSGPALIRPVGMRAEEV